MSTPRTKRQFAGASADPAQRHITSFFTPQTISDIRNTAESLRQPALPSSIQANLLSVGMRVRKSVPEGYKTIGTSAFKLWTDNTRPSSMKTPATTARSVSRELLPFCGINRVGGLDTQAEFVYDDNDVPALDELPELTLSQESIDSAIIEPSRKRLHDDDEGTSDGAAQFNVWDGEVSPRSVTPVGWGNARVIAVPQSRIRKNVPLKDVDQENVSMGDDFDDAEFLVLDEGKEMDLSV